MKRTHNPELTPSPRSPIGEKVWQLITEKFGFIELSEQSQRNLVRANELLKDNSLIVYVNHTSTNDVPVGIGIALSYFTNAKRILAPAGMKHYDLRRDFKNGLLMRMMRILRMQMIPVIQQNDDYYPPEKKKKLSQKLKARATKLLSKAGSIYAITPEETRSTSGNLLPAKQGIGRMEEFSNKPLYYLPIVILFHEWNDQPQVIVGEPLLLHQIHQQDEQNNAVDLNIPQQVADMHMRRLAQHMPEERRGYYK